MAASEKKIELDQFEWRLRQDMSLVESLQKTSVDVLACHGSSELNEVWSHLNRVKEQLSMLREKV